MADQILPGTGRGTGEAGAGAESTDGCTADAPLHHAAHGPPPRAGEDQLAAAITAAASRCAFSATPRLDAELLAAHALGVTREAMLLAGPENLETPPTYPALVDRRAAHEPVAYIIGTRAFWTIELAAGPGALVPRADSETLIEAAVAHFAGTPGPRSVLDLGTGSGALLLAALAEWPDATGVGVDASPDALTIARENARRLGLADRARIVEGGWSGVARPFDLVLCNPPYIAADAVLPREIADWEPASALYSGPDGQDDLDRLADALPPQIAPGGVACVEIGADQGPWTSARFARAGFDVTFRRDLGGRDRCLVLTRKNG